MNKTVVLKEVDISKYPILVDFENVVSKIHSQYYGVYVKFTPKHFNDYGRADYYEYSDDVSLRSIDMNMDFKFSQWYTTLISYLVFVDGDKMRILKNRFDKRQKMVIVA